MTACCAFTIRQASIQHLVMQGSPLHHGTMAHLQSMLVDTCLDKVYSRCPDDCQALDQLKLNGRRIELFGSHHLYVTHLHC